MPGRLPFLLRGEEPTLGVLWLSPRVLRRSGYSERRHGHLRILEHHDIPLESRRPPVVIHQVRLSFRPDDPKLGGWMWAERPAEPPLYSIDKVDDQFVTRWFLNPPGGAHSDSQFQSGYEAATDACLNRFRPVFERNG